MDSQEVKQHASGHWREIISRLSGIPVEILDCKNHGCPKCGGGKDRFRAFNDFDKTGGVMCNQCFTKASGNHCDGFSTLQWLTGKSFPEIMREVMDFLGLKDKPKQTRKKGLDYDSVEFKTLEPGAVSLFLAKKPPITFEAIQAVGGRFAIYQKLFPVIMVPVWGEFLTAADPCGWIMFAANGGPLFLKDKSKVKLKMLPGTQPGVIINTRVIKDQNNIPPKLLKVEGPTDVMATLSLSLDLPVFTNSNGAGEYPKDIHQKLVSGRELTIVHDADEPGQKGLETWVTELARSATLVRKLQLPYEVQPNHGKDIRDWLNENNEPQQFKALVDAGEIIQGGGKHEPEESEDIFEPDDPDRLARINLRQYESRIGGRVVYYKGSLFRWTKQKPFYCNLPTEEFTAKARPVVKTEFIQEQQSTNRKRVRPITNTLMSNIVKATESQCLISQSKNMPFWLDQSTHPLAGKRCLSLENGLLDLEKVVTSKDEKLQCTSELGTLTYPHSSDWFSMSSLPVTYDSEAICHEWVGFLVKAMEGDWERVATLQEWMGYLLLGSPKFQKCLLLVGEGGNGKSVFLAGMRALLGANNYSTLSIEDLNKDFELANLHGKLANITADMNEVDQVAEGVIKAITSGDPIHAKVKYKSGMTMIPTARLVFATNNLPRIADRSQGIWRRIILVPFDYQVKRSERIYGMDTEEYWQKELPGMLEWALMGLARLARKNEFTQSAASIERLREYREDSNPLESFFQSYFEPSEDSVVPLKDAYKLYRNWCVESGSRQMNNANFGRELQRSFKRSEGFKKSKRRVEGIMSACFEGIKIVQENTFAPTSEPIEEREPFDE